MRLGIFVVRLLWTGSTFADTVSYTGTLSSTETIRRRHIDASNRGFGGGTNAAGTVIPSGGFDPFVGVFESSGDLIQGTSDGLSNYASFTGCLPAGLVTIGSVPGNCGDITMALPLVAGTYTVRSRMPSIFRTPSSTAPSYDNLNEGFTDLTGDVFQTCADLNDCNNDTANWALDVTTRGKVHNTVIEEANVRGMPCR